jgi:hypothetical protein
MIKQVGQAVPDGGHRPPYRSSKLGVRIQTRVEKEGSNCRSGCARRHVAVPGRHHRSISSFVRLPVKP